MEGASLAQRLVCLSSHFFLAIRWRPLLLHSAVTIPPQSKVIVRKPLFVAQVHIRDTAGARTRASKGAMAGCQSRKLHPTAGPLLPVEQAALAVQVRHLYILFSTVAPSLGLLLRHSCYSVCGTVCCAVMCEALLG